MRHTFHGRACHNTDSACTAISALSGAIQDRVRTVSLPDRGSEIAMRVLVVEDDKRLASVVKRGLEAEGYAVDVALDGTDGKWLATEQDYDAIVMDIMLPGINGFRLCGELRDAGNWTPILMLTAKRGEWDEAEALDTGADDFLSKPFSFVVLLARLRALLRRRSSERPVVIEVGDLRVDPAAHRVWRGDDEIHLTSREFAVLEYLVRNAGSVVTKPRLLDHVWDFDFDGDPNIVEVYVGRLRRKIDDPFGVHSIDTVRGVGYRMDPSA
jgi:DNA-binding response OmpR family regulator